MSSDRDLKQVDVSCVPHHHTITEAGRSHFSRICDGLAEFVDNSIQACREKKVLRDIHIEFFLRQYTANTPSFLCIADNGCGMNQDELKAFATFSLDRKTRGFGDERDPSGISKFGVGAKQAGFFLGDRLRVITKNSKSKDILELVMDRKEFDRRWKNNEDMYKQKISIRSADNAYDAEKLIPENEKNITQMQDFIHKHETRNDEFTIIIICLSGERTMQLLGTDITEVDAPSGTRRADLYRPRYLNLAPQLAEIYHFHLHPDHHPMEIGHRLPKFKDISGTLLTG